MNSAQSQPLLPPSTSANFIQIMTTRIFSIVVFAVALIMSSLSVAKVVWNPGSNFDQYTSYAMFFDPQSDIYTRSGGNAWGALGGAIALVGLPDLRYPAQVVMHGSANVSYRLDQTKGQTETKTETIDARVGLSYDMEFSKTWRAAVIWTHESGHISDNIADPALIGIDVGNEAVDFRVIHDINEYWRLGAGIKPYVKTHPAMKFLWAEQFAEWYPEGASPTNHVFRPYFALGLTEGGVNNMNVTVNAQAGIAAANHFRKGHSQGIRALIGYYNGNDPRMKYQQYRYDTQQFMYAGFAFDL